MAKQQTVAIVGAGLAGRLLALSLTRLDVATTLFDADSRDGKASCGHTGAGMLAPYCELESAEPLISDLGIRSLAIWPQLLASLDTPVFFQQNGSLVVAHPNDEDELQQLARHLPQSPDLVELVTAARISELEPALAHRFTKGLYVPDEGQIDNRELLPALACALEPHVTWRENTAIPKLSPNERGVTVNGRFESFDWVIDCRGLGASTDLPELRGVRGEILLVHAPEVKLNRPVRMMHPRYPLYIVPRRDQRFVIGATTIESEDHSPISVRSMLELLSAAYTLHPGFAEGRILESSVNCRPAFPDHMPRLELTTGFVRLNGLYRHGFLLSPVLVEAVVTYISTGDTPDFCAPIVRKLN